MLEEDGWESKEQGGMSQAVDRAESSPPRLLIVVLGPLCHEAGEAAFHA